MPNTKKKHPGGRPSKKDKHCKQCGSLLSDRRNTFCNTDCKNIYIEHNKRSHLQQHPDYDGPDTATRFKHGNQFWKARSTHGPNPIFSDPEKLKDACVQYFQWVDDNPLQELKVFSTGLQINVPKMRMMTIQGLCLYIGIDENTWARYRNNPDLGAIVTEMEYCISQQKLTGAAADLLNANIVCREMGLRDKQEHEHTGSLTLEITKGDSECL